MTSSLKTVVALSRLGKQIEELVGALNRRGIRFALIGGLALAPHKVIRATQDIELLTDAAGADGIDEELLRLGYRCVHRSADAGNYLRKRMDALTPRRQLRQQRSCGEVSSSCRARSGAAGNRLISV